MGRRALKPVDPTIDLSFHLVPRQAADALGELAELFPSGGSLELEIGSGKGLFLASAAAARPAANFLGVEIAARFARFAAARLARAQLRNTRVVHGDARKLLAEKTATASLSAVHVYFPDPWWKQRHAKRRMINPVFIQQVERVLVPGGRFCFWTDVQEYFRSALQVIAEHSRLAGPIGVAEETPQHDLDYRTHFERRMRLHGHPVYRAEFCKPTG